MNLNSPDRHVMRLFSAVLRREDATWPVSWTGDGIKQLVLEQAHFHGVVGLLNERKNDLVGWPADLVSTFRDSSRARAIWELRHQALMQRLLGMFAKQDVPALLLKGTALAYDLYEPSHVRVRGDTDILVDDESLPRARTVLTDAGFLRVSLGHGPFGDLHYQECWSYADAGAVQHQVDLHWRLINSPALAGLLDFQTCASERIAIPRLSPGAFGMQRALSMLHACLHRVGHVTAPYYIDGKPYNGSDRLIWIMDIHLLANSFSHDDWEKLIVLAKSKSAAGVCLEGLNLATQHLSTVVPPLVMQRLKEGATGNATHRILSSEFGLRSAFRNIASIDGVRAKLHYLAAQAFPSREFLQSRYPRLASWPPMMVYIWRILRFFLKRI